ncbi:hypothetical protein AGMMS49957_09430 [Synergistales bacterium]|nr:hypothetical protein AGMMS49957_09430 [Synergistales bacterium]
MKTKIRARSGFTFVEVLLSLILGGVLSVAVVEAAATVVRLETRMANRSLALERGWNVLSVLEPRALHAALGLTASYRDGDSPLPGRWAHGPLYIWRDALFPADEDGDGVFRGRGLSVLYSIPSGLRADLHAIKEIENNLYISLLGDASQLDDRLPVNTASDIRSWTVFPLSGRPVSISNHSVAAGHSSSWLTIRLTGVQPPIQLYPYDELHYLRAARFFAENAGLYAETFTTAWKSQGEMLEGVLEMWFEWTPSKRRLEVWILTTGGESSVKNSRPSEWPASAPWKADFERQDMAVTFGSWILKNL